MRMVYLINYLSYSCPQIGDKFAKEKRMMMLSFHIVIVRNMKVCYATVWTMT